RRRGRLRPVGLHRHLDVLRVAAEVEDVVLADAQVLEELPRRVGGSIGDRGPQGLRHVLHRVVEARVRVLPVQQPAQVLAQGIVAIGHHSFSALRSAPLTRHIVLPVSSATSRPPCVSRATPTGRPYASPLSARNPLKTSTGGPEGMLPAKGTKITF